MVGRIEKKENVLLYLLTYLLTVKKKRRINAPSKLLAHGSCLPLLSHFCTAPIPSLLEHGFSEELATDRP